MESLTDKQEAFCREYLVDLNATQAAVRAGYSEKTASVQGHQLLQKTSVRARVKELMDQRAERQELDADWVLSQLVEVVQRSKERKPVLRYDGKANKMVQVTDEENGEGVYKFDSMGANRALELIGKHLKMFDGSDEKTSHPVNVNITFGRHQPPDPSNGATGNDPTASGAV